MIMEPDKGSSVTAKDLLDALVGSEELALSPYASDAFSIWMASSFLGLCFLNDNMQKKVSNIFVYYIIFVHI